MNISSQTATPAPCQQSQHGLVASFNGVSNHVEAHFNGHSSQRIKVSTYAPQLLVAQIQPVIIRCRLVMHDACVLSVQVPVISLDEGYYGSPVAEQVFFWTRHLTGNSND